MDTQQLPKGQSPERHTDGRPVNMPGTYTHKDTGVTFITSDGDEGISQADALMHPLWKDAWERTGEVPTRVELLAMRKAQEAKDAAAEVIQKKQDAEELKAATKAAVEEAKELAEVK